MVQFVASLVAFMTGWLTETDHIVRLERQSTSATSGGVAVVVGVAEVCTQSPSPSPHMEITLSCLYRCDPPTTSTLLICIYKFTLYNTHTLTYIQEPCNIHMQTVNCPHPIDVSTTRFPPPPYMYMFVCHFCLRACVCVCFSGCHVQLGDHMCQHISHTRRLAINCISRQCG